MECGLERNKLGCDKYSRLGIGIGGSIGGTVSTLSVVGTGNGFRVMGGAGGGGTIRTLWVGGPANFGATNDRASKTIRSRPMYLRQPLQDRPGPRSLHPQGERQRGAEA